MTLRDGGPWLVSLAVHVALVGGAVALLAWLPTAEPPAIRMRLVSPGTGVGTEGTRGPAPTPVSGWMAPSAARKPLAEPSVPAWTEASRPVPASSDLPPVPVSLDELLAGSPAHREPASRDTATTEGWRSPGGEGYQVPPLPPPGLAPPQGASWTLVLTIPGTGGYPLVLEGLDSGHPDLDRWLESNLRTISFPAGLDGRDYQLRWVLNLESGRPR